MTGVIKIFDGKCGIILNDNGVDEYRFSISGLVDVIDIGDDVKFEVNEEGFAVNIIYQMEL
ncbi:MAG: hypothetical protein WC516_09320 [Patescibacteria group bacterium]|jgi:hypothetical protein